MSDIIDLVKILTDIIFQAVTTLKRIEKMSDEEVKAAIEKSREKRDVLIGTVKEIFGDE